MDPSLHHSTFNWKTAGERACGINRRWVTKSMLIPTTATMNGALLWMMLVLCPNALGSFFFSFFPQFLYTPGHFVSISQQLQLFFWRTVFSLQILLCLWTGELKRAWKFRSPEGGLDQWPTDPGIWMASFFLLVTLRHNLYSRVLVGTRLKLPSARLYLKSSLFLPISPFLSCFSHSLPDLPWEDFLNKSQIHTNPYVMVWF